MVEKKTWTPILLFLGCAAFAVLLQFFSAFHSQQNSDSLMVSIMSYTRPTMFYWGQDQWLSLLPLLFCFIKDPGLNLFFITLAQLLCLSLFPYVAAGLLPVKRKGLFWALSVLPMALLGGTFLLEAAFQPYSVAILVALLGLRAAKASTLARDGGAHLGLLAIFAAFALVAIKVAEPVIVLIMVWWGWLTRSGLDVQKHESRWSVSSMTLRRQMIWFGQGCVLLLLMVALAGVLQRGFNTDLPHRTMLISPDPGLALRTLVTMVVKFERFYDPAHLFAGTMALGTLAGTILLAARRRTSDLGTSGILFVLPALLIAVTMSSLEWVRQNASFPRYLFIPIFLLVLNFAFLAERALSVLAISSRMILFAQTGLAMGAATLGFLSQRPSPYQPIKERIGSSLKDAAVLESAAGKNGAIGDYWRVWPFVWTRNAYGDTDFVGISLRSQSIKDLVTKRLSAAEPFELMAFGKDDDLKTLLASWYFPKDLRPVQVGSARIIRGSLFSPGNGHVDLSDTSPHQVGGYQHAERAMVSHVPQKGFLVFGPYIRLRAGDYVASLSLSIEAKEEGEAGWADVFSLDTSPRQQIVQRLKAGPGIQIVDLPFRAQEGPMYEFRVWSQGTATVKVTDIEYHRRRIPPSAEIPIVVRADGL